MDLHILVDHSLGPLAYLPNPTTYPLLAISDPTYPFIERAYTVVLYAGRPLLPLLGRGGGKLAMGVRGRRGAGERMARWAKAHRDPSRPLVWFHAPSVGEGLQARAVIEAFRARHPEAQVAYTYFSPSAQAFARQLPVDVADYLPLDLPGPVGRMLDLLRPSAIVFSKTDVWPTLTREAARRGIGMALLSATLPTASSRLRRPARALLSPAYRRLAKVGAISAEDARRFGALGVLEARLSVMGDARFDQVAARARNVDREGALLAPLRETDRTVVVAGSTWAPDEEALLTALAGVDPQSPTWRLILVPHEPTERRLREAEERAAARGLACDRLSRLTPRPSRAAVLLVDRVGVLGDLYALADVAYVGGGFGTAGLHSVLEPAAYGVPVLFGPRYANAREAGELIDAGAAWSVAGFEELAGHLRALLGEPARRTAAGTAARSYVSRGQGAAERGAEIVHALLDRSAAA